MKKIKIMSLIGLLDILEKHDNVDSYIVSIRDPQKFNQDPMRLYEAIDYATVKISKGIISEYFLDASPTQVLERDKDAIATSEQIIRILEWTKDKDDIIVHCSAGVSRSSAVGYLIACLDRSPEEAIKILNSSLHWPNEYIVKLAVDNYFNNDINIINVLKNWKTTEFRKIKELNEKT